jgi:hypothetical protein
LYYIRKLPKTNIGDAETLGFSLQKFQGILARLEILLSELETYLPQIEESGGRRIPDAMIHMFSFLILYAAAIITGYEDRKKFPKTAGGRSL